MRLSLACPGVQDNPGCADFISDPESVLERGHRLAPDLPLLAGAVDQIDGVDHHRLERRVRERLAKLVEVVLRVGGGPPHPRALVEDLDRIAVALDAAPDGVRQSTGRGNMRADQHSGRSFATDGVLTGYKAQPNEHLRAPSFLAPGSPKRTSPGGSGRSRDRARRRGWSARLRAHQSSVLGGVRRVLDPGRASARQPKQVSAASDAGREACDLCADPAAGSSAGVGGL